MLVCFLIQSNVLIIYSSSLTLLLVHIGVGCWTLQNELEGVNGDDITMSLGPQSTQQLNKVVANVVRSMGTLGLGQIKALTTLLNQSKIIFSLVFLLVPLGRTCLPSISLWNVKFTNSCSEGYIECMIYNHVLTMHNILASINSRKQMA